MMKISTKETRLFCTQRGRRWWGERERGMSLFHYFRIFLSMQVFNAVLMEVIEMIISHVLD